MATKTRMLDFRVDPNEIQQEGQEAYKGMGKVVGTTQMMDTLATASRHFHMKEEERSMIEVDRQLNKIDMFYSRQFSKLENYGDEGRLADLNTKYVEELGNVEKYITESGFTKSTRTQAVAKVNNTNDKIENIQTSGLEVKQMQTDINTVVEQQTELTSQLAVMVKDGIQDHDQADELLNQYYDNIKQREDMSLITSAEGKAEFSALFTKSFDQGMLVRSLQMIDDNPLFADMTDPEVVRLKKEAQASVLEKFDVEMALEQIGKATSGDKYRDYIDMNQVELALDHSHKEGTRANLKLLGQLQAFQKSTDAQASQQKITEEKAMVEQQLKESYAERDLWSNLASGMSFVEAENKFRETLDLEPKYLKDSEWLHDEEYLASVSGSREVPIVEGRPEIGTKTVPNITPEMLADIDNDIVLQYGFLGTKRMTEIESLWGNDEMPEDQKYEAINNLLITTLNGDLTMLPYVIKEASGKIKGLDKGMLYVNAFPSSGNSGQIKTYKETNTGMMHRTTRANVREEEFKLRQEAYTTSGKGKKIDLYNDRRIELAQRESQKGIALTRTSGERLYTIGRNASYLGSNKDFTYASGQKVSSLAPTTSRQLNMPQGNDVLPNKGSQDKGVFSPQTIGEVLNEFKISNEELTIQMADGTNKTYDSYSLSAMIYNEVGSDDPFIIEEVNGYILDAYVEMTGKTTGTDMIHGLEPDRAWGYVNIGDVSPRVTAEGMRRYVRQKVLQLARPQDTPNPDKTTSEAQQYNFLGVTQY